MAQPKVKKRNHEVQRAYLEQWRSAAVPQTLSFVDLRSVLQGQAALIASEVPVADDKGRLRSPAEFAIEDYLYVPDRLDGRDDSLEDQFAEFETHMVDLCRAARNGGVHTKNPVTLKKALFGCMSHGFRDAYGWRRLLQELFEWDADAPMSAETFPLAAHDWLVRNARNAMVIYDRKVSQLVWTIHWNIPIDLLTGDRPAWDLSMRPGSEFSNVLMALGPNTMLQGVKPSPGEAPGSIQFVPNGQEHASIWQSWNTFVVERARSWIVASSANQLAAILPELTHAKLLHRVSTEKLVGLRGPGAPVAPG